MTSALMRILQAGIRRGNISMRRFHVCAAASKSKMSNMPKQNIGTASYVTLAATANRSNFLRRLHHQKVIKGVVLEPEDRLLFVTLMDVEKPLRFPYVHLRDHCPCPKCWNDAFQTKVGSIFELDVSVQPAEVKIAEGNTSVVITWSDCHVSSYDSDWLLDRSFDDEERKKRLERAYSKHEVCGREQLRDMGNFDWTKLSNSDKVFLDWMLHLKRHGLALIKNAPKEFELIDTIGARIGHWRLTHHSDTYIIDSGKTDKAVDLAYTSEALDLHSDLPYYEYVPGVILLHCLEHTSSGGESIYSDAIGAALQLKERRPDLFAVLSETLVDYYDIAEPHEKNDIVYKADKRRRHPVIRLDEEGEVSKVHYNHLAMDSYSNMPVGKVQLWYEAFKLFSDILMEEENLFEYTLSEGDIVAFDNSSVLHGRKKVIGSAGRRSLRGGFLDWDVIHSKIRVLGSEHRARSQKPLKH